MITNLDEFINLLRDNENNKDEYLDLRYYLNNILNQYEQINFYSIYLPFIIKLFII